MAKVSLRAYNREIETMIDRGQLDEAIAHCHHIFKTFPKHLETYRLLGKAYLEYKRYGDAVDIFTRVLVCVPDDFVANVGMSIIRDEENKLDDAIWHMERAFEVQPSNAAIQGELQRLYGRRDGVQPPRIRMTRGALAHMYVQGELYPQAISEIKSVLKEDGGRSDMQALLARAHYKSGQKNEGAEVASSLLRRYPYCLDANRVLAEILGADKPENAQAYRQRVVELDPYAAQVNGTLFQSSEAADAAVTLEHLDWNGQPVGATSQADWRDTRAISVGNGIGRDEQPDWLKQPATQNVPTVHPQPKSAPVIETPAQPVLPAATPTPADDIPDFLRDAGWGKSTGAFDESKSSFAEEEPAASSTEPLAQGDLPDWVKAMAPKEETQSPAKQEEDGIPDWISKIGPGSVAAATATAGGAQSNDMDWLNELGSSSQPSSQPANEQPDWLKEFETSAPPASGDQPDWLKELGSEAQAPAQTESNQPDWLKGLDGETAQPTQASTEEPDWLKELGEETPSEKTQAEESDWLRQFDVQPQQPEEKAETTDFSFLDEMTTETQQPTPAATPSAVDTGSLGTSEQERDDSFAWLEALAAKQGASEGLLTKPEDRLEEEPDWVKQAKGTPAQPSVEQTPAAVVATPATPAAKVEDLGKSQQEIDDSLAWLEALAAKQGATEGLLTKPEERMESEPEWVKRAKSTVEQPREQKSPEPVAQPIEEVTPALPPVEQQPAANVEDLGKSQQEIDDSLAWLESLAAKQGATEGLLTKPEERMEQEPDWVKQAKSAPQVPQPPAQPVEQIKEEPVPVDDTAAWLQSLDDEEVASEPESTRDETAMWLKSLDEAEVASAVEQPASGGLPAWMQNLEEEKTVAAESAVPEKEAEESVWMESTEEPVAETTPKSEEAGLPSWLSGLEQEEKQAEVSTPESRDDLPSWLRDETGEVVAEPTKIEPTRTTDWHPMQEKQAEISAPPPPVEVKPEPKLKPEAKPAKKAPAKPEVKPAAPPEPYREPVTRRGTGMLTMPIDPILDVARIELSRSNIPGALETYGKLIKKGRFLDEVIFDLREALYRYPVEVSIWQSLGDAYMRANRLQDALDAYTKAEELLR